MNRIERSKKKTNSWNKRKIERAEKGQTAGVVNELKAECMEMFSIGLRPELIEKYWLEKKI